MDEEIKQDKTVLEDASPHTFTIRATSTGRFVIGLLGITLLLLKAKSYIFEHSAEIEWYYYSQSTLIRWILKWAAGIGIYLLSHRLSSGIVSISVDGSGVAWYWQRRFLFSKATNGNILWSQMRYYKFEQGKTRSFELMSRSWRMFYFQFFSILSEKDFRSFEKHFLSEVNKWNEQCRLHDLPELKKPASYFITHNAWRFMFFIIVCASIFIALCLTILKHDQPPTWVYPIVFTVIVIYSGYTIFARSKSRKQED